MKQLLAFTIPGPSGPVNVSAPYAINCPASGCLNGIMQYVIQLLFGAAMILSLFFLIWGGIDWIMSRGDTQKLQKARLKLTFAIIGLVIVFLAFGIVSLFGKFLGLPLLTPGPL